MFDTVNFWIDRCNISGGKPFEILPYLSEITERQSENSGYSCVGKLKNYSVYVSEYGISLYGSLAKYYLGNNIETLTRETAKLAIEQLFSNLHLDKSTARVTRFDVATVIPTQRPPADYFRYLGEKSRFKRLEIVKDETLYYNNKSKWQIAFYDKTKESKAKGVQIPEILQNTNLFRYELRYTKRLNKLFGTDVTASTLTDEVFYRTIIQNWYNEFNTIPKLKEPSFVIDNITTVKEAEKALFAYLLQQSGQSTIDEYLSELKAKNAFKERQRYSELKRKLNKALTASTEQKNELMQELEEKILVITNMQCKRFT